MDEIRTILTEVDLSTRSLIDLDEWDREEIVQDDEDEEEEDFQSFFLVRFLLELFFTFLAGSLSYSCQAA